MAVSWLYSFQILPYLWHLVYPQERHAVVWYVALGCCLGMFPGCWFEGLLVCWLGALHVCWSEDVFVVLVEAHLLLKVFVALVAFQAP